MKFTSGLTCTICHKTYSYSDDLMTCPVCGEQGILDIEYDYEAIKQVLTKEKLMHNPEPTILRYQPLMSIEEHPDLDPLQVGHTPLYKGDTLGKKIGLSNLYIKDEGMNPTQSLKDRASLIACIKALEAGVSTISCSSTGNAASSLAGNAARLGLKSVIFVPERSPIGKRVQMMAFGATVIAVKGDYKEAFRLSKDVIDTYHFYNRNAAINPHMVEGKKTVALELIEQMNFKPIDNVFVSVGDGCTIYGVFKGFKEAKMIGLIDYMPRIFGVQSSGCSPFVDAWEEQRNLQETDESTIADSIAVGIPRNPIKGMKAVCESDGKYLRVTDDEILQAQQFTGETEGLFGEPAAATSVAGVLKAVAMNWISKEQTTIAILTGNGLKDTKTYQTYHQPHQPIESTMMRQLMKHGAMPFETIIELLQKREGESS